MILYDQKIKSTFNFAANAVDEITALLRERLGLEKAVVFRISFMLRELINNAVEHGNQFDEEKEVHVQVIQDEEKMSFGVKDEGPGFELTVLEQIPDQHLRVRNRGIILIREFGFEIEINNRMVWVHMPLKDEENNRGERHD